MDLAAGVGDMDSDAGNHAAWSAYTEAGQAAWSAYGNQQSRRVVAPPPPEVYRLDDDASDSWSWPASTPSWNQGNNYGNNNYGSSYGSRHGSHDGYERGYDSRRDPGKREPYSSWSWSQSRDKDYDDTKEYVPTWDGAKETLKVYLRRVDIYVTNSKTSPYRQGGKLLERLQGDASKKTEALKPADLKAANGVDVLILFLRSKYEPFEALRIGNACDKLTQMKRPRGQEIRDFDTDYESALNDLETLIGVVNPFLKAHFFLKGLRLPGVQKSQVITGALNTYNYEKLRDSAVACITNVSMLKEEHHDVPPRVPGNFQTRAAGGRFQKRPHRAHEVENGDGSTETDERQQEGEEEDLFAEAEAAASAFACEGLPAELLEAFAENEAFITQAKKSRSEMEKARDFYKKPTRSTPPDRIAQLKSRLPCVKCGKLLGTGKTIPSAHRTRRTSG